MQPNPGDNRPQQRWDRGTSQSTTRPLEYHDHNHSLSSSLLSRGEQLLSQTAEFEVQGFYGEFCQILTVHQAQAHEGLSDFGSVISAIDTSSVQLSASRLLPFLNSFFLSFLVGQSSNTRPTYLRG